MSSKRPSSIPDKANTLLNVLLVIFLIFTCRIWILAILRHDEIKEEALRPRHRVVLEPARRGTIRDRFNEPLAINKMNYQAAILYAQIRQIPSVSWQVNEHGEKVKVFRRKEYIKKLAELLGSLLQLDKDRLEEEIHAKAAMYFYIPYIVKTFLTEEQYYRLKMLEKDWLGIVAECVPIRHYPRGKVACDIVGYLGAITKEEYELVLEEIRQLEAFLNEEESIPPQGIASLEEADLRLKELHAYAYSVRDQVGKSGVEGRFEEWLRGFHGKKVYFSDSKGNYVKEAPGSRDSASGRRLLLSVSADLQEFAEELLARNERIRKARISRGSGALKEVGQSLKDPWIKGGSIIAMDPNTGEVLALASHPRFDPNDFVLGKGEGESTVLKWFETEKYLGQIWEQKEFLTRELFDPIKGGFYEERQVVDWPFYLQAILPKDHPVLIRAKNADLNEAIAIQTAAEQLLVLSGQGNLPWLLEVIFPIGHERQGAKMPDEAREVIEENLLLNARHAKPYERALITSLQKFTSHYDKTLYIDLLHTAVDGTLFSPDLLKEAGAQTIRGYRDLCCAYNSLEPVVKSMALRLFREIDFSQWRSENAQSYLKEMRRKERESGRYARPYLDYLDEKERQMFTPFWDVYRYDMMLALLLGINERAEIAAYLEHFILWHEELIAGAHSALSWRGAYELLSDYARTITPDTARAYFATMRTFDDLDRPLYGAYPQVRTGADKVQRERHLALSFYPRYGYGYSRSFAYRQATVQGSIFKLITAYEALRQRYHSRSGKVLGLEEMNPMRITDFVRKEGNHWIFGARESGEAITPMYRGGRIPRSVSKNIGEVDLFGAFEHSSNPYFALLAAEMIEKPEALADAARSFSYGEKTGIDLPGEYKGRLPLDLADNKSGLYSFAIGHHNFTNTPLQTAVMLSAIVNGGYVLKPQIVKTSIGKTPFFSMQEGKSWPYKESLALLGIDFPLFLTADQSDTRPIVQHISPHIRHKVDMPPIVRDMLLTMMDRVADRIASTQIIPLKNLYAECPEVVEDFQELASDMGGKTSTSEAIERIDLDCSKGGLTFNHIWYGSTLFSRSKNGKHSFILKDRWGRPELVVVVYLQYGSFGKDAVPIAAAIGKKWREIRSDR